MNKSPSGSKKEHSINLTHLDSENEVFINLAHISSPSTCNTTPSDDHLTYDSEPINSDTASHISDLSSSTNRQKPKKFEKVKLLDEARMAHAPVDMVEEIPWGIDGDHIYKIKCSKDEWISKYEDGRSFFLKDSSCKDLVGKRKFGKCLGSFICKSGDCPKLTSEDVVNTIDFRQIDKDQYVCACCGYIAHRDYCGCIKAVEYDRASETLTYYHQGEHICGVKPNVREHRKALNKLPFPITAYTKPMKYMKDVMYHYIDKEDYNTGFDVSKALSQADVIAEIKKLRKNPEHAIHRKDELKSFAHVNRIQETLLKSDKDKYLVY